MIATLGERSTDSDGWSGPSDRTDAEHDDGTHGSDTGADGLRRAGRDELARALLDTRDSTRRLVDSLQPGQRTVPQWPILNPPVWELGHVGWFHERWCLRRAAPGRPLPPSRLASADLWFDSSSIPHEARWSLDLPPLETLHAWMDEVLQASIARLRDEADDDAGMYFHRLALFHEQFHIEALVAARQAIGLPQPGPAFDPPPPLRLAADVRVPGGEVMVGTPPEAGFAFDNEQDAHPVRIAAFDISMQPVTNAEFLQFVEDGGYHRARMWSPAAFAQITEAGRVAPAHWRRVGNRWQMRWFDRWVPLEPYAPVVHVDAFEAEAWCAWAGRRLPTETEWEHAASSLDGFEWGDTVWEWTASPFVPYAGFRAGPYADYSEPWFGTHRVVRGGSFATPPGLLDARMRNFYRPERGDVFVGFRSCAPR
jgi:ergothioneine biosynthesis protein EgtB